MMAEVIYLAERIDKPRKPKAEEPPEIIGPDRLLRNIITTPIRGLIHGETQDAVSVMFRDENGRSTEYVVTLATVERLSKAFLTVVEHINKGDNS